MKRNIFKIFIILILFSSCDDFLEPKSQDKIIPKNITDLKEFLLGEVIKSKSDAELYLAYMTDDVGDHIYIASKRDKKKEKWGYYAWQQEPELTKDNKEYTDNAWDLYYHKIFICNVILDEIPNMDGTKSDKNRLIAETKFMRAHSYFRLVNLYGEPYDKSTANTALGVPINDEVSIENKRYERASVAEVYKKIEEDLFSAEKIFTQLRESTFSKARPNILATYLLLSRMYLYKKEYINAEKYASLTINTSGNGILDISDDNFSENYGTEFLSIKNSGILFTYGAKKSYDFARIYNCTTYRVSEDLMSKFSDSDLRKDFFLKNKYSGFKPQKFKSTSTNSYGKAYRLYEAYLNRAEANYYLGEYKLALNDLKYLYAFRHNDAENITTTQNSEILDLIKLDRRLEFCFEDHRWFDLRRYGMPELTHRYITETGEVNCVLPQGSKAYTLPIPRHIRTLNTTIGRIQRPELNVEK